MQRELHLAKEARYSEAFSTLHEERRKNKRFDDIAADVVAKRRGSHDVGSPDDGDRDVTAWAPTALWRNTSQAWSHSLLSPLISVVVKLFYTTIFILRLF